jgi:hypothetical protein
MTWRTYLVLANFAYLLTGCGGGPKLVPVSGHVTLDSKPLANATIQFVPVQASDEKTTPISSIGTTAADGSYSLVLNTNSSTSGAVAGKHKVIITLGAQGDAEATKRTYHKQLPERYNRKTELECDVPATGRDDANFNLTSK